MAVSGIALLAWNLLSWSFPFFWDTVLNSKIATWYWANGYPSLVVPESLDAGHPPFFSLYLALSWEAFGRSLATSHAAMLPWLALLLWQYQRLAARWLSPRGCILATVLLFCEPTFMAQSSMPSPDIVLVSLHLLALNALLDGKRATLFLALVCGASMSMRGILAIGPMLAIDLGLGWAAGLRKIQWRRAWPYLLSVGFIGSWFWVHWHTLGWLVTPPASTYGGHRQILGFGGIARNLGVIGWRLLDFGRVFAWLSLAIASLLVGLRRWGNDVTLLQAGTMLLIWTAGLGILFLPFSNPIGHRYFLLTYLLLLIALTRLGELMKRRWLAAFGALLVAAGLLTGNLWIYPRGVAQGWDSSLAHLSQLDLLRLQRDFFRADGISPDQVCTTFPFCHNPYYTHLEDSLHPWMRDMEDSGPACDHIFYSKMAPGFSREDYENLESSWDFEISWQSWDINHTFYRRPDSIRSAK